MGLTVRGFTFLSAAKCSKIIKRQLSAGPNAEKSPIISKELLACTKFFVVPLHKFIILDNEKKTVEICYAPLLLPKVP